VSIPVRYAALWASLAAGFFPGALRGQSPASLPAAAADVMQPTRLGLRLTPEMARALMRAAMQDNFCKDMTLSDDQEQRLADCAARRLMRIAHRDGRESGPALEYFFETMMANEGKIGPENAREFGGRMRPLVQFAREVIDGMVDDARLVLEDAQFEQFKAQAGYERRKWDRLDAKLQSYAEGQLQEEERPLAQVDREEARPERPKPDDRIVLARSSARLAIRRVSMWICRRFLAGAAEMFKFDDAQKARGEALVAEFQKKAGAIMTPEWTARVERNRILSELGWLVSKDVAGEPWCRRLDKQYKEDTRPLVELRDEFYQQVLALVTPQQRVDALEAARQLAEKHGLAVSEGDLALLRSMLEPALPPAARAGVPEKREHP
jgi:hypothetical protein